MRPLLIGQAPGSRTHPDLPLYHVPRTSAGGRLRELMGITPGQYLTCLDRMNLLHEFPGRHKRDDKFPRREARAAAAAVIQLLPGRHVVFVGRNVADAFGYTAPFHQWCHCPKWEFTHVTVPHPSGRNHWYNDPGNREAARAFWRSFIEANSDLFIASEDEVRQASRQRLRRVRAEKGSVHEERLSAT